MGLQPIPPPRRRVPLTVDEWLKRQYIRGEITLEQFEKRIEKFIRIERGMAA